ncbi:Alkaline phosphatase synthesis transcriptional regulatory protein PhoP [Lacunisphaera limnophila]|uniref:Alkaline phosphatase synthesis transcriptional regulatory protein PhoP n=2 Tax=Lacunisphaera limnophila TaxID=1838286 RepID=A0A1D8AWU3_9BACT|nr:Alkaline phosphatase synthesis transcriptional regulatory protein PhoP [Lacunisphaera limnophila]
MMPAMSLPPARILAVDDEPELTELMQYHLVRAGHQVTTAANGWEAIASIRANRPDIILLDLMLPDLDGFGVCEILRRDPSTATIPIVIVSAWSSPDSRLLGLELGALDYLTKPFSPQELVERVNRLIHARAV